MMTIKKFTATALISCMAIAGMAQNNTDSLHTKDIQNATHAEKNLRFSILGGPGYTPDYGILIGGAALFTFRTVPSDKQLQRSVVPLSFGLTFAKPLGVNVMVKPQIFFKDDRLRLFGTYYFKNTNDYYFGIDYDKKHGEIERGDNAMYTSSTIQINPILLFKLGNSDFFMGPMVDFLYEKIKDPGVDVYSDNLYKKQGGTENGMTITTVGAGGVLSYDTRDVAANAYKGVYFELKGTIYDKVMGSEYNFADVQLDYRQYLKLPMLGERRVLAWNVISKNVFGDVPFTRYSKIGNPFDLRGFYLGQYRNKSTLVAMAEYRHMFNFGDQTKAQRFWSRFGFAAWGGTGFMGEDLVSLDRVFPNFGAGLRVELQPRMNFRVDVGYSPIDKQTLLYFNMTEAF